MVGAFEHFAATVKSEFVEPFEEQPWNNFFQSAVSFLTQESLQLEEFSPTKRNYITQNYGDMRKRATELIRQMWFSLGESKRIRFVPTMVGTVLDMAFVPECDVRKSTIPIFFDMMHCEFDQERIRRSFEKVEDELIRKVVEGFEGGKGDMDFRVIFYDTMSELCLNNRTGLRDSVHFIFHGFYPELIRGLSFMVICRLCRASPWLEPSQNLWIFCFSTGK